MKLVATKGPRNQEQATATCDGCGRRESVIAAHTYRGGLARGGSLILQLSKPGQALKKLEKAGWPHVGNKLRCAQCEAGRQQALNKKTEDEMTEAKPKAATTRKPTSEQEVDIIVMLSSVYDRRAGRYQGAETDLTVADACGNGVMPGWVAAIREAKFGPAGNEEAAAIRAEMDALRREVEARLEAIGKRLDACTAAHDKRVV